MWTPEEIRSYWMPRFPSHPWDSFVHFVAEGIRGDNAILATTHTFAKRRRVIGENKSSKYETTHQIEDKQRPSQESAHGK